MQTSTHFSLPALSRLRHLGIVSLLLAGLGLALPATAQMGIGTTAPNAKAALDIVATDKGLLVPRLTAVQRGAITTPPVGLLVYQTDGAQPGFWYYEATAGWTFLAPTGADNLGNHAATQNVQLNANWLSGDGDPEGVSVSSAGRVGVGVPGHFRWKLTVGDTTNATLMIRDLRPNGVDQRGPHLGLIVGPTGAGYEGAYVDYIHSDAAMPFRDNSLEIRANGSNGSNGRINFFGGNRSALTGGPHVTIRENGWLGIGLGDSLTPYRPLHVYGGIHTSGAGASFSFADRTKPAERFVWYAQDQVARLYSGNISGGGTDLVGVTRSGKMGIGTTSPAKLLHLYSGNQYDGIRIQVAQGFGSGSVEYWSGAAGGSNVWRPGMIRATDNGSWTGGLAFFTNGTGQVHKTDSVEVMRLVNRRVGIGVTTPGVTLQVRDTSSTAQTVSWVEGNGTLWAGSYVNAMRAGARPYYGYARQGSIVGYHFISPNGDWVLNLGLNQLSVVTVKDTTGFTGLGTTDPKQLLHLYSAKPGAKIRIQASSPVGYGPAGVEFWSDPPGSTNEWRPGMIRSTDQGAGSYTGGLAFYVNGAGYAARQDSIEVMRLTNNKVGIGTANPVAKLHVVTDNSLGGGEDDYLFDTYGDNGDLGIFMRKSRGTVAAPQNVQFGDRVGLLSFSPRVNNALGYFSGSDIQAFYMGDGTTQLSDLRFSTSAGQLRMRLTETGNVGIATFAANTRLTISPSTTEPKITLWDGGSTTSHYGFGISGFQLNYHVNATSDNHVFYAGGKNGDGTELARITGSGLMGIGTSGAPSYRLHVHDTSPGNQTVAQFDGANTSYAGIYANASVATASPFYGYKQGGIIKGYHGLDSGGDWYMNLNGNVRMLMDAATGNLGIGTNSPIARLHISGGSSVAPVGSTYSFFSPGNSTLSTNTSTAARNVAAYIEGGQFWVNSAIVAGALNTSSDRRIKQVVGVSDSHHDLELLNRLRITDYRYIDQINNTRQVVKKVIAQEVEEVLPAAVTSSRMAIPDVYEVATEVRYAGGMVTVRTGKAHGFRAGDQVRLYNEQQRDLNPTVTAVEDAHTFTFEAAEAPATRLFVYGKFVDDFRSVDYDALAMLNVSATQELARQLKELQERNRVLEQRAAKAEAVNQSFESRLRALEAGAAQARK